MFHFSLRVEDDEESSSGDDEEDLSEVASTEKPAAAEKISGSKETQAGAEISALVNYIQPVHFTSFENSESKYVVINNTCFDWYYSPFFSCIISLDVLRKVIVCLSSVSNEMIEVNI